MTTLIKNVVLVDGTGKPPAKADVLLKDDKISAIGSFPRYGAHEVIDGMNAFLAPGFINSASLIDRHLALFTGAEDGGLLTRGITTVIAGHGGISLAPLLYGSLEALSDRAETEAVNVNWHTVADFFKMLGKRKLGVNFGMLVGETTMTHDITGQWRRPLSDNELHIFLLMTARSLAQGALGVSMEPSYGVGFRLSDASLAALARLLEKQNAPLVCDLGGDETATRAATESLKKILRGSTVPVVTLGVKVQNKDNESYCIVAFDNAPREIAGAALLPASLREKEKEEILVELKSDASRKQILKEVVKEKKSDLVVARAPGKEYLEGKTVSAFAENRNLSIGEGFLALLLMTDLRITFLARNRAQMNPEEAAADPRAIVASPFDGFLKTDEKEGRLPIEKRIQKITAMPALLFGIEGRGVIREGYYADLVLFKDGNVQTVFVNGKAAVKNGEIQSVRAGKLITRAAVKDKEK